MIRGAHVCRSLGTRVSSESYHSFMWNHLFKHVDVKPENVHILDGNAPDLDGKNARSLKLRLPVSVGLSSSWVVLVLMVILLSTSLRLPSLPERESRLLLMRPSLPTLVSLTAMSAKVPKLALTVGVREVLTLLGIFWKF